MPFVICYIGVNYNGWVHIRNPLRLVLILSVILAAVLLLFLYSGIVAVRQGDLAMARGDSIGAARMYQLAAGRLIWRADLWDLAGQAAYRSGSSSEAISLLEQARRKGALSADGWDILGLADWTGGDHATALSTWQAGSKLFPSSPAIYDHLAMAYHEGGDFSDEQQALTQRLALADDAAARYRLGLLLTFTDPKQAFTQLTTASHLDPEFDSAVQTIGTTLNIAAAESDPANRWITLGRGLGLVEEWGLASRAFEEATQLDGRNAEAWAWLGEARQHLGQDGSNALDMALSLDPRDVVVHGLRGLYWKRQGDDSKALAEYLQAAQLDSGNPAWQASIGEVYTQMGSLVSALTAYQTATQLAPNDPTYWRLLAAFCSENGVQVLGVGLPAARKAADLAPRDAQVLDVLGWSYLSAGYYYSAEQTLKQAIQIEPGLASAHLHLAETYLGNGARASALDELNRTIQLDPGGPSGQIAGQMLKQYFQ